jgi:hypothetical protein
MEIWRLLAESERSEQPLVSEVFAGLLAWNL